MKIDFKKYTARTKLKNGIYLIINDQDDYELIYVYDNYMSDYPSSRVTMPLDADCIKKYIKVE